MFSNNSKTYCINLLLSLIPISFIAGNLILNSIIGILLIISVLFYKFDFFRIKTIFIDRVVLVFFSYALLLSIFNVIYNFYFFNSTEDLYILFKTLAYFRFLILYFLIRYLIEKDIINFKTFFISCSLCSLFVCLDLIYQFLVGKDVFGYKPASPRRLSGPFGDELIAGSYLQRFSIFLFFLFPIFSKIKNKIVINATLFTLVCLITFSIIISGNRMPFLLFIFTLVLIFLFHRNFRKYFVQIFLIFSLISALTYNTNNEVRTNYRSFIVEVNWVINSIKERKFHFGNEGWLGHYLQFHAGYKTWEKNKLFGGGIRSFKNNCTKRVMPYNCGSHPHNYYLEILSEVGLIGLIILSTIFFSLFYRLFIKQKILSSGKHYLILPFLILFLVEIFPIKSSGSFFSTANATYFFLIMAITIALSHKKKIN